MISGRYGLSKNKKHYNYVKFHVRYNLSPDKQIVKAKGKVNLDGKFIQK